MMIRFCERHWIGIWGRDTNLLEPDTEINHVSLWPLGHDHPYEVVLDCKLISNHEASGMLCWVHRFRVLRANMKFRIPSILASATHLFDPMLAERTHDVLPFVTGYPAVSHHQKRHQMGNDLTCKVIYQAWMIGLGQVKFTYATYPHPILQQTR